jgi:hypothetical protein
MRHCTLKLLLLCALYGSIASIGAQEQKRAVASMSVGSPTSTDIQLAKTFGLKLKHAYSINRKILMEAAWQPDLKWGLSGIHHKLAYQDFPEILCGDGYDAVCTGRFVKGSKEILLTIDHNHKTLPVMHADND